MLLVLRLYLTYNLAAIRHFQYQSASSDFVAMVILRANFGLLLKHTAVLTVLRKINQKNAFSLHGWL